MRRPEINLQFSKTYSAFVEILAFILGIAGFTVFVVYLFGYLAGEISFNVGRIMIALCAAIVSVVCHVAASKLAARRGTISAAEHIIKSHLRVLYVCLLTAAPIAIWMKETTWLDKGTSGNSPIVVGRLCESAISPRIAPLRRSGLRQESSYRRCP